MGEGPMRSIRSLISLSLLLAGAPLAAQEASGADRPVPDPATVTVPEIIGGRDENVVKDGWKYFYFWRADTSFEQAYADFSDCYRFLPVAGGDIMLPAFVTWEDAKVKPIARFYYNPQYGIVGALIGSMLAGPTERRASQSRMRRCLEPRGYQRFPVAKETWDQIIDGYSLSSIAVSAKLASGSHPDADPLPETR
jgi:hypothetical protein